MTLSADHTAVGDVIPSGTAAENLSMGQVCYLNSNGKWALADADAYSTAGTKLAVCIEGSGISTDATGKFLLWGVFRDDSITVTKGAANYLSTTAGAFTETAPSGTDDVIKPIATGWGDTHTLFFEGLSGGVEHT